MKYKNMHNQRLKNLILFFLFLIIEILIARYVHDSFVRPYFGDMLVVVVLYFFVGIWLPGFPEKHRWLPLAIFLFAAAVEVLQYFHLVEILGVEDNPFLRTVLGATFDFKDIICYAVGCLALWIYERILYGRKSEGYEGGLFSEKDGKE